MVLPRHHNSNRLLAFVCSLGWGSDEATGLCRPYRPLSAFIFSGGMGSLKQIGWRGINLFQTGVLGGSAAERTSTGFDLGSH